MASSRKRHFISFAKKIEKSPITLDSVHDMLEQIKQFAIEKDGRFLESVMQLIDLTDKCKLENITRNKQTKQDSFFKKNSLLLNIHVHKDVFNVF